MESQHILLWSLYLARAADSPLGTGLSFLPVIDGPAEGYLQSVTLTAQTLKLSSFAQMAV